MAWLAVENVGSAGEGRDDGVTRESEETDWPMGERTVNCSNLASPIPAVQVPVSDFSYLKNRSNVSGKRIRIELHRVLRRASRSRLGGFLRPC